MTDPYYSNPDDPKPGRQPADGSDPYAAPAGDPYASPAYPPPSSQPLPGPDPYASMPPGGYPVPGSGQPPVPPGTNNLAIVSLVCGIVGFFCCGLLSIAGLITGFMAMNQIKQTGQDGHGIALAGTIVSGVSLIAGIGYAVYGISSGAF